MPAKLSCLHTQSCHSCPGSMADLQHSFLAQMPALEFHPELQPPQPGPDIHGPYRHCRGSLHFLCPNLMLLCIFIPSLPSSLCEHEGARNWYWTLRWPIYTPGPGLGHPLPAPGTLAPELCYVSMHATMQHPQEAAAGQPRGPHTCLEPNLPPGLYPRAAVKYVYRLELTVEEVCRFPRLHPLPGSSPPTRPSSMLPSRLKWRR